MFRRVHLRQDPPIVAAHLVDQRNSKMQAGLVVRIDDFAADRFDGELPFAHREQAGTHEQDHSHQRQQYVQRSVLHHRTPRARAGSSTGVTWISGSRVCGATVMVSFGLEIDSPPRDINLSSGRYFIVLLPLLSTITSLRFLFTLSLVS